MAQTAIDDVDALERDRLMQPQVPLATDHVIHGGIYSRTILIPAGVLLTGALIKVPTTLVLNGDVTVWTGIGEIHLRGHNVLPASAGRKQAFVAHTNTFLTMLFPTSAKTVEEAEREFTDEWEMLASHSSEFNSVLITGE